MFFNFRRQFICPENMIGEHAISQQEILANKMWRSESKCFWFLVGATCMGGAPRPVGLRPSSLYKMHKLITMCLPCVSIFRLSLPAHQATVLGISMQFVFPPEPLGAPRSPNAQLVWHQALNRLPSRVAPFHRPAGDAIFIHSHHMTGPLPLVLQMRFFPQAHSVLFGCANCLAG